MAIWDKQVKKAPIKLVQKKILAVLVVSFCSLLLASSVRANIIDPPVLFDKQAGFIMMRDIIRFDVPFERPLFWQTRQIFFNPLSKKFNNVDEEVAIKTLILEAAGEGYKGMVAVGEVIRNRTKLFHAGFEAVCLMPKQFSCWNDRTRAEIFLKKNSASYALAQKAWKDSEKSCLTGGATDYHTSTGHPYWADVYSVTSEIGNHIFYVRK
jgi:hypothetical protein